MLGTAGLAMGESLHSPPSIRDPHVGHTTWIPAGAYIVSLTSGHTYTADSAHTYIANSACTYTANSAHTYTANSAHTYTANSAHTHTWAYTTPHYNVTSRALRLTFTLTLNSGNEWEDAFFRKGTAGRKHKEMLPPPAKYIDEFEMSWGREQHKKVKLAHRLVPPSAASGQLKRIWDVAIQREEHFESSLSAAKARASMLSQRAFDSYSVDMPEVAHPRLCSLMLPEILIEPVLEVQAFIQDEYTQTGTRTLSGDGSPVIWPWEREIKTQVRMQDPLDRLINIGLDNATSDGSRGRLTTGVKAWFSFCADEKVVPDRPLDPLSPLVVKLKEEWLCMRFVCALVQERGVAVATAAGYFSATQGWHARVHGVKLAGGLKLERLPQMLKGLRRIVPQLAPKIRRGLAPQALRKAMDVLLDPANPEHANMRAALATAFLGLLRGEEFAIDAAKVWRSADRLTRADIVELTPERVVIMMHPCKNMKVLSGKTVPLVLGAGGKFIDAVAEIRNMLRVDPAAAFSPKQVPLFRVPATNSSITKEAVHEVVKELMLVLGENPAHFGTHSLRIGGATALFAAGADPTVIRTMGRWSSDIYRLYVRACFERCCDWTKAAGSTTVTDVVVEFDEVDEY